jgi:hypothetical protein
MFWPRTRPHASLHTLILASALAACASDAGPDTNGLPAGETVVYESDYPAYDTLTILYERADVVVEAYITGSGEVREMLPDTGVSDPS